MFQNDKQRALFIIAFLSRTSVAYKFKDAFTMDGPSRTALRWMKQKGGPLSHGEAIILSVAFDFWGGHGWCKLEELMHTLDGTNLRAVADALLALADGPSGISRYIAPCDFCLEGAPCTKANGHLYPHVTADGFKLGLWKRETAEIAAVKKP